MTTDMPLARYSAVNGALTSGFVIAELHHLTGRDPKVSNLKSPRCGLWLMIWSAYCTVITRASTN